MVTEEWAIQDSKLSSGTASHDAESGDSGKSPKARAAECATVPDDDKQFRRLLELWRKLTPAGRAVVLQAAEKRRNAE